MKNKLTKCWFGKRIALVPLLLETILTRTFWFFTRRRSWWWTMTVRIICGFFTLRVIFTILGQSRVTFPVFCLDKTNGTFAFTINPWNDVLAVWVFVIHFALMVIEAISTNFGGCKKKSQLRSTYILFDELLTRQTFVTSIRHEVVFALTRSAQAMTVWHFESTLGVDGTTISNKGRW